MKKFLFMIAIVALTISCRIKIEALATLLGNVNQDGNSDMIWSLTAGNTNRVQVALATGDGKFHTLNTQQHPESIDWTNYRRFTSDINGDGSRDLIWNLPGAKNHIYVGLAKGDGTFTFLPKQLHTAAGSWNSYKTYVGDVNGDGLDDLIWNAAQEKNHIYVGIANNNGTFTFLPKQLRPENGWTSYKTLVGDINGDGRADLIWNAPVENNHIYVGLANSDGSFTFLPKQLHSVKGSWKSYKAYVGDVNGDGRDDLIWNATVEKNHIYVGLGNSNGTFTFLPKQLHSATGTWNSYNTYAGDVNGDGRDDLIWNATQNKNHIYVGLSKNDGTFLFLPRQQRPENDWNFYQTYVSDVNGDGRADLVWNNLSSGNYTATGLANSNGTFTFVERQSHPHIILPTMQPTAGDISHSSEAVEYETKIFDQHSSEIADILAILDQKPEIQSELLRLLKASEAFVNEGSKAKSLSKSTGAEFVHVLNRIRAHTDNSATIDFLQMGIRIIEEASGEVTYEQFLAKAFNHISGNSEHALSEPSGDREALPEEFQINQNYPNPFNPSTTIYYALPQASEVELMIFDVMGRRVRTLMDRRQQAGRYAVTWDGRNEHGEVIASGVYLYQLRAGTFVQTRRMTLMR